MKSLLFTILLLSCTSYSAQARQSVFPDTTYRDGAEQLMKEEINLDQVSEELTRRVLKISGKMDRYAYPHLPDLAALYDNYEALVLDRSGEVGSEAVVDPEKTKVIILPFIPAHREKTQPDLWGKSIALAREAGADYILGGVLESAEAEPIRKEHGSYGNTIIFAGFEGAVSFRIKIYDLRNGVEMENKSISDRGILKKDVLKTGSKFLAAGVALAGGGSVAQTAYSADRTSAQVGTLVDATLPKTKSDAINDALNRAEKYLKTSISENFPTYFNYLDHIQDKKSLEITFENKPESDLVVGHKLELISNTLEEEESYGYFVIKQLSENEFTLVATGKSMQVLLKKMEKDAASGLMAKFGKERKTAKAKLTGLF